VACIAVLGAFLFTWPFDFLPFWQPFSFNAHMYVICCLLTCRFNTVFSSVFLLAINGEFGAKYNETWRR